MREDPDRMAASIVAFCRFARSRGLPVGMHQTLAALEAAEVIGLTDWQRFSFALRAVLCSSQPEWEQFDQLFEAFWSAPRSLYHSDADRRPRNPVTRRQSPDSRLLIGAEGSDASSRE